MTLKEQVEMDRLRKRVAELESGRYWSIWIGRNWMVVGVAIYLALKF